MRRIALRGVYAVGVYRYALVDDARFDELNRHRWKAKPNGSRNQVYAVREGRDSVGRLRTLRMHRIVLAYDGPLDIDHVNGNSLDNRQCNLRVVTRSENLRARLARTMSVRCPRCLAQREVVTNASHVKDSACRLCKALIEREARRDARDRRRATTPAAQCARCQIEVRLARSSQRYCSEPCRKASKWKRQRETNALPPSSFASATRSRAWRAARKAGHETT